MKTLRCSLWLLTTCWLTKIAMKLAILLRNAVPRQTVIAFPVSLQVPLSLFYMCVSMCDWTPLSAALDHRVETEPAVTGIVKIDEAVLHSLHSSHILSENRQRVFFIGLLSPSWKQLCPDLTNWLDPIRFNSTLQDFLMPLIIRGAFTSKMYVSVCARLVHIKSSCWWERQLSKMVDCIQAS